jgi:hypothetical protein
MQAQATLEIHEMQADIGAASPRTGADASAAKENVPSVAVALLMVVLPRRMLAKQSMQQFEGREQKSYVAVAEVNPLVNHLLFRSVRQLYFVAQDEKHRALLAAAPGVSLGQVQIPMQVRREV